MLLSRPLQIVAWLSGGLPLLLAALRWLDQRRWAGRRSTLGDESRAQFAYLARQSAAQLHVLRAGHEFTRARHEQGEPVEALRLLSANCSLIEHVVRDMLAQLHHLNNLSRPLAAFTPVRPPQPTAFRLWRLRGLALLAVVGQGVLVTTPERFRFKVLVLGLAWQIVARRGRWVARRGRRDPGKALRALQDLDFDMSALRRETLDALRALLVALERPQARAVAVSAAT